jgi:hypothetical protein
MRRSPPPFPVSIESLHRASRPLRAASDGFRLDPRSQPLPQQRDIGLAIEPHTRWRNQAGDNPPPRFTVLQPKAGIPTPVTTSDRRRYIELKAHSQCLSRISSLYSHQTYRQSSGREW